MTDSKSPFREVERFEDGSGEELEREAGVGKDVGVGVNVGKSLGEGGNEIEDLGVPPISTTQSYPKELSEELSGAVSSLVKLIRQKLSQVFVMVTDIFDKIEGSTTEQASYLDVALLRQSLYWQNNKPLQAAFLAHIQDGPQFTTGLKNLLGK